MSDIEDLHSRLDALWSDYLDLLDVYAKGQEQIQKHFAAGFFSLAQANARAPIGRRYGSDWYDDRTKATARISIDSTYEQSGTAEVQTEPLAMTVVEQSQTVEMDKMKVGQTPIASTDARQQPTPPATPGPEDDTKEDQTAASPQRQQQNPLFWFGMLPPPNLRSAQSSFRAAVLDATLPANGQMEDDKPSFVQSPLIAAVSAARGMRVLEIEIKKLRKTIRHTERASQAPRDVR